MKKLSIGLLAAALSLPFAFGATQSTPSSTQPQAQTQNSKTTRKHVMRKKHANKKSTGAQNNNAKPQSTSKTPAGK